VAVQEQALLVCRCLLYRAGASDAAAQSAMSFECSCSISVRADVAFAEQSSVSGSGTTGARSTLPTLKPTLALLALQHSLRSFVRLLFVPG